MKIVIIKMAVLKNLRQLARRLKYFLPSTGKYYFCAIIMKQFTHTHHHTNLPNR